MPMSSPVTTSFTRTSGTIDRLPSFTPPCTAMCEWVSMIPGMATRPAALITLTLAGAVRSVPTALILPFSTRIEPLAIVPRVTVKIVASLIRTSPPV